MECLDFYLNLNHSIMNDYEKKHPYPLQYFNAFLLQKRGRNYQYPIRQR